MGIINYELRITNKKIIFVFFIIIFLLAGSFASAQTFWSPGQPIVPCGGTTSGGTPQPDCDQCLFLLMVRNLVDIILIFVAPVVGTLFLIIGGVMIMLGGGNPGLLAQGKRVFKDTLIGIIIIFLAWLITNTIVQTFAKPNVVGDTNWWTITCPFPSSLNP